MNTIHRSFNTLLAALMSGLILLSGCGTSNQVISKGPFQKRKYRPGWSVDMPFLNKGEAGHARTVIAEAQETPPAQTQEMVFPDQAIAEPPVLASVISDDEVRIISTATRTNRIRAAKRTVIDEPLSPADGAMTVAHGSTTTSTTPQAMKVPGDGDKSAGTNGMAIAGFVCSFFIPILGIIFSAIGLGQCKRRGQKGKGFAIAGLAISILTILIFLALAA
jgi:Domain of unknown function (DUF4190)